MTVASTEIRDVSQAVTAPGALSSADDSPTARKKISSVNNPIIHSDAVHVSKLLYRLCMLLDKAIQLKIDTSLHVDFVYVLVHVKTNVKCVRHHRNKRINVSDCVSVPKRVDPAVFALYPVAQAVLRVQAHGPGTFGHLGSLLSSFFCSQW